MWCGDCTQTDSGYKTCAILNYFFGTQIHRYTYTHTKIVWAVSTYTRHTFFSLLRLVYVYEINIYVDIASDGLHSFRSLLPSRNTQDERNTNTLIQISTSAHVHGYVSVSHWIHHHWQVAYGKCKIFCMCFFSTFTVLSTKRNERENERKRCMVVELHKIKIVYIR